jgi:hypothetical protein
MQLPAHRLSRGILIATLVTAAPMALAGAARSDVKTNPLPVDQVLGRASGEAFFQTRPEVSAPPAVTNALDKAVRFLTEPPNPARPERFGRGGGNLPAGG